MPNVITITLSPENRAALENLCRREQVDEVVNRAISDNANSAQATASRCHSERADAPLQAQTLGA